MSSFTSSSESRSCLYALIAGIVAVLLLCIALSEWFLRSRIVPEDFFWKHVDLFLSADAPDAAFGDSQMARGFTGTEKFVNLAYPADSILQIRTKMDAFYLDKNPGRVILEAGVQMLSSAGLEEFPRDYEKIFAEGRRRYAPFGLYIMDGYYRSRVVEYIRSRLSLLGDPNSKTLFLPAGGLMNDLSMAEVMTPADWKLERILLQKRITAHVPAAGFEKTDYAVAYQDILSWLIVRGASVCMVTMPVMPFYRETLDRMGYRDRFAAALSFFTGIAGKNGVRYVSYWDKIDDPVLFINADHLNSKGSRMLTPRIIDDCFGTDSGSAVD